MEISGYQWVKTLHIIFVTSWFAGLFYLPRIFVNLAQDNNPAVQDRLMLMAQKLYRFMTILMIPALVFGLILWLYYGVGKGPGSAWMHAKLLLIIFLIGYHHMCGAMIKKFRVGNNKKSHVWYRWFNEVPVLLLTIIVVLVVIKPF
ncbi:MAG: CopD family protein [Betaproteobacteria bacterium]|jgi:putative membrane protein|nr:CopD family protein [Polynucleobacter sp.]NBY63103.1 CopD family protein [Betaproteobacteria bacterium]